MPQLQDVKTVAVRTHLNDFGGMMSHAALIIADDGAKYVIKRAGLGRPLVAEHVVARLGRRIGAPCMDVCFATLPAELLIADPNLGRFAGGRAHASGFVDGLVEIRRVTHEVHLSIGLDLHSCIFSSLGPCVGSSVYVRASAAESRVLA